MKKTVILFVLIAFVTAVSHAQTVVDIDGNVYNTVTLGTQTWMQENLKTTRYCNGDSIGTTIPATLDISAEIDPKYQWAYNGLVSNVALYGRLYTYYAITDSRNVCPTGWVIPSDADWTILTDYLTNNGYGYGGSGNDIGKSTASMSGWNSNEGPGNVGNEQVSNNSSGFTAIPAGARFDYGTFDYLGIMAGWWSSTQSGLVTNAWGRDVYYDQGIVYRGGVSKKYSFSIRCIEASTTHVKDNLGQDDIKIYPNPATDFIFIDGADHQKYYIYNVVGAVVMEGALDKTQSEINIGTLVPGLYVIRITGVSQTIQRKFIVE